MSDTNTGFQDPTIHGRIRKPMPAKNAPRPSAPGAPPSAAATAAASADAKKLVESLEALHKKLDALAAQVAKLSEAAGTAEQPAKTTISAPEAIATGTSTESAKPSRRGQHG